MNAVPSRPNILLITSDQQHYSTLGRQHPVVKTPELDRLAAAGATFHRAYCPNPTCTPTRSSIITGKYPSQHGAWSLGTNLSHSQTTVGELLQKEGYSTALIGKAHFEGLTSTPEYPSLESHPLLRDLDYWRKFNGPYFGFEHIELLRNHTDEYHAGQHYGIWLEDQGLKDWRKYFPRQSGNYPPDGCAWELPEKYHYNEWIVERTNAALSGYAEKEKPFFLWASFPDPHPPYLVPDPWASLYDPAGIEVPEITEGEFADMPPHFGRTQQKHADFSDYQELHGHYAHGMHSHLSPKETMARNIAIYYGMITYMDQAIGRVLSHLDTLGMAENTLVVFTTDHGHFYGQHGLVAKGPFHYEDLIRVPFIARWPGHIAANHDTSDIVSLVDLAPTFLGAAQAKVPIDMTGMDLHRNWCGESGAPQRKAAIVENRHQPTTIHVRTYVDARYKITVYYNREYGEIFDLQEDPGEIRNLWSLPECAELKSELLLKLIHTELGKEPLSMPRIGGA